MGKLSPTPHPVGENRVWAVRWRLSAGIGVLGWVCLWPEGNGGAVIKERYWVE